MVQSMPTLEEKMTKFQSIFWHRRDLRFGDNIGLFEASKNSKELDSCVKEIATITGQQPTINTARKSVAGFKIRDGMSIGASVTLRKDKMFTFLTKLQIKYKIIIKKLNRLK